MRPDRLPEPEVGYFIGAPDLAVEVVSPNDRVKEVDDKAKMWLTAGTRAVWVVWPSTRSVVVYRAGQPPRVLTAKDTITGEEVLPGFECRVAEFFGS